MMDPELQQLQARCSVELPSCAEHEDSVAVAFCGSCGSAVCESCLAVVPTEVRCPKCRPASDRLFPTQSAWLAGLLSGLWKRPWVIGFVGGTVVFSALVLLLPGLMEPNAPAVPKALKHSVFHAPYLDKAFRLGSVGDIYAEKGMTERATARFARVATACRTHLETEKNPYLASQVKLGLARNLFKAGDAEGAVKVLSPLLSLGRDYWRTAGVANLYLAEIYDTSLNDKKKAVAHYRGALAACGSMFDGPAEDMVDFHDEKGPGGKRTYTVAALTGTVTSPRAARPKIVERLEALTGEKIDPDWAPALPVPEPRDTPDEQMMILKGR